MRRRTLDRVPQRALLDYIIALRERGSIASEQQTRPDQGTEEAEESVL